MLSYVLRCNTWPGSNKLTGLKNIPAEDRSLSPTSVDVTKTTSVRMSQKFLGQNHRDTATYGCTKTLFIWVTEKPALFTYPAAYSNSVLRENMTVFRMLVPVKTKR